MEVKPTKYVRGDRLKCTKGIKEKLVGEKKAFING